MRGTMKIETDDLTVQIDETEEKFLANSIIKKYDTLENERMSQLSDIKLIRNSIYNQTIPKINAWESHIELPDIYELAQTLKSHLAQNLYSHPDAMFDVTGTTPETQEYANKQKAMLVNTFEQMKFEDEIEKIIDSVVETGKCSNADWDNCAKIYRTYSSLEEIFGDKSNNLLTDSKLETLKGVMAKNKREITKAVEENKLEILEYWGDIELSDGRVLKNKLAVIAGRQELIRFESNPFVINPFVHANIIENPTTGRGISPLRVALILNNLASTILNKQIDALALMMNPPYLAPKGCFRGQQDVQPGKIIEYDAALMPNQPVPLSFDKAMQGWDFLNYFKATIESATGIFKNMAGNIQTQERTATELNYSANGQEARLNLIIESINRKILIPTIEKTAEIIANFKLGTETITLNNHGRTEFIDIDDNIRNANYIYRYGDRKANFERKSKLKELFEIVSSFAQVATVSERIDWIECFKFALEQYGVENSDNFLLENQQANINSSGNNTNA